LKALIFVGSSSYGSVPSLGMLRRDSVVSDVMSIS